MELELKSRGKTEIVKVELCEEDEQRLQDALSRYVGCDLQLVRISRRVEVRVLQLEAWRREVHAGETELGFQEWALLDKEKRRIC